MKQALTRNPQDSRYEGFNFEPNGSLRYKGRIYVPDIDESRNMVWKEVHEALYVGHLGVTRMMTYVKLYFWKWMKGDVARFVARCLECQRVKEEHHNLVGLLYPHDILERK